MQDFIDDYPYSKFVQSSDELVNDLRNKLAQKEYETARMYIKLEKYSAAIIYLNEVISNFYDTLFYEKAHLGIMLCYSLNNDNDLLNEYYQENINQIKIDENILMAEKIKNNNLSSLEFFKHIYRWSCLSMEEALTQFI